MIDHLDLPPSNSASTLWSQASLSEQMGLTTLNQQVLLQKGPAMGSGHLGECLGAQRGWPCAKAKGRRLTLLWKLIKTPDVQ